MGSPKSILKEFEGRTKDYKEAKRLCRTVRSLYGSKHSYTIHAEMNMNEKYRLANEAFERYIMQTNCAAPEIVVIVNEGNSMPKKYANKR